MAGGRQRISPLTIVVPVHRLWSWWLRATFPAAESRWPVNRIVKAPLLGLQFIHFAHWGLVTRVPRRGGRRLPVPYIIFHTNYNGDLQAYVDAFALVVPGRLRAQLCGAYDFPGTKPVGRFRDYFLRKAVPEDHWWCAYPSASVKTVAAGLGLAEPAQALGAAASRDDAAFAAAWQGFLREHGRSL